MLSQENRKKIIQTGLYKREIDRVKKSASPSKERQLECIDLEIDSYERKLRYLKEKKRAISPVTGLSRRENK